MIQLKMPVNIVLMSEGMFVARDRQSMTMLGRLAAEARASSYGGCVGPRHCWPVRAPV